MNTGPSFILSEKTLALMGSSKKIEENQAPITSIDFSYDGSLLAFTSDDETIRVYKLHQREFEKISIPTKKYGVDLIKFLYNDKEKALHTSKNGWDETIRMVVIAEKKYERYFKGHRDRVVSLAVCPGTRNFMSSSLDDTVRLWDARYKDCMGLLHKTGRSVVSFDPTGTCFAVASATNVIKLYDIRSFDKSPFSTFYLGGPAIHWGNINFSNNGKYLLLSTLEGSIYLFDAFKGDKLQEYTTSNNEKQFIEASFSPDDQFVLSGSDDGHVQIWDSLSGRNVAAWDVAPKSPITAVKWNPTMMLVAAAGKHLDLWTPLRPY